MKQNCSWEPSDGLTEELAIEDSPVILEVRDHNGNTVGKTTNKKSKKKKDKDKSKSNQHEIL